MATGLEEAWKGLRLTEEEAAVVEYVEDTPEERLEQVSLFFACKLLTESVFKIGGMKSVLTNVWKHVKGIVIKGKEIKGAQTKLVFDNANNKLNDTGKAIQDKNESGSKMMIIDEAAMVTPSDAVKRKIEDIISGCEHEKVLVIMKNTKGEIDLSSPMGVAMQPHLVE
ncbi:hypothetical protein Cgig2_023050 [Carnegiea gigantea]|uniref:Uncharacterized protein n=1 Tax=Carnegiea gigantea TaxID=171969 RepID=A0A9Q1JXJ6_9CARY|nr:hypothetical protein Cgig2_023050 [Carnegiea gigantea]